MMTFSDGFDYEMTKVKWMLPISIGNICNRRLIV